jgi:hypothetical protein
MALTVLHLALAVLHNLAMAVLHETLEQVISIMFSYINARVRLGSREEKTRVRPHTFFWQTHRFADVPDIYVLDAPVLTFAVTL